LKRLAAEAERASEAGNLSGALAAWREALDLLPPDSRQHQLLWQRVSDLSRQLAEADGEAALGEANRFSWKKAAGGLGVVGLLLWKFKFLLGFLLTKAKLLIFGLTKASTLFSMLLSLSVYWAAWGFKFALGLIASLYIHEVGHVAALRRFGIKATAPMFVPGLGAFVRLKQYPSHPGEDARVGLAGPIWGMGAALAAYLVYLATGFASWAAIARVGAWINLFNLMPLWQLDGGRGFRALARGQRFVAALALAVMWSFTGEGLLILLLLVAAGRALAGEGAATADRVALYQCLLLVVVLAALAAVPVPLKP
jgi:Zn-dependent protease